MGGGRGGNYGTGAGSAKAQLQATFRRVAEAFPLSKSGTFGSASKVSGVRLITSNDPAATAERFFRLASKDATRVHIVRDGVTRASFGDGSHVIWRPRSHSDGSPVVELNLVTRVSGLSGHQKIHFVKES